MYGFCFCIYLQLENGGTLFSRGVFDIYSTQATTADECTKAIGLYCFWKRICKEDKQTHKHNLYVIRRKCSVLWHSCMGSLERLRPK